MKKLLVLITFYIYVFTIFSESKPIVQIDPIVNMSEEDWLEALCIKTANSVSLTLKLLGRFDVSMDIPDEIELIDIDVLRIRAETEGYDNIIFGSCSFIDGNYIISMNAYDRALNKITYSNSTTVESIFDTLDAIDQIIDKTVEGFSGIHVTYGSLKLIPPTTGEPISFTIDNVALPTGVFTIEKIPSGVHQVAVTQNRPLGLHVATHDIVIDEKINNQIPIPITLITKEESIIFNNADNNLRNATLEENINSTSIFEDINILTSSTFFKEFRPDIVYKYEKWKSLINDIKDYSNQTDKNIRKRGSNSIWNKQANPIVDNIVVSLTSQFEIKPDRKLLKKVNKILPDFKTITIDGKADDWEDVTSGYLDPIGDSNLTSFKSKKGSDIIEVKYAIDTKYLYIMLRSADEQYINQGLVHTLGLYGKKSTYYNYHLYREDNLWVGISNINERDFVSWDTMETKLKFRKGEIFETAIHLNTLIESSAFSTEMRSYIGMHFDNINDNKWELVDEINTKHKIVFPLVELLIKKENK
ncbi:MAG: hypothetical protein OCD02_09190 [Spirochaetaceae bacterium]